MILYIKIIFLEISQGDVNALRAKRAYGDIQTLSELLSILCEKFREMGPTLCHTLCPTLTIKTEGALPTSSPLPYIFLII